MKKFFLNSCLWIALLIINGCSQYEDYTTEAGRLVLNLTSSSEILTESNRSSTAYNHKTANVPNADDFHVSISNHQTTVAEWDSYKAMQQEGEVELRPSSYQLKAWYGKIEEEGISKPYYEGTQDFTIERGKTTQVSADCYIRNSLLAVSYTENFKKYFTSYGAYVISSLGNNLAFPKEGSKDIVYVKPGEQKIYVKVKKQGQTNEVTLQAKVFKAEARHLYTIEMDVDAGSATLLISFKEELKDEPVRIDVSDAALNAPAPRLTASFDTSGILNSTEGMTPKELHQVYITAEGRIASCQLTTASAYLQEKGWAASYDLTKDDLSKPLELGLRLKGLTPPNGKMAMIDFQEIFSSLPYNAEGVEHTFTLSVVDRYQKVSEPLTIRVVPLSCEFALQPSEEKGEFLGKQCTVKVHLKGDPAKVKYSWTYTGVAEDTPKEMKFEKVISQEEDTYLVQLSSTQEAFTQSCTLHGDYLNYRSEAQGLIKPGISIEHEGDVWARKAIVHLFNTDFNTVKFQHNAGGEWTDATASKKSEEAPKVGTLIEVKGIPSGKEFAIRALSTAEEGNSTNEVKLRTEDELQIPNAGFEDWHNKHIWTGSGWPGENLPIHSFYPYKEGEADPWWSTRNDLTTNQAGNFSFYYVVYPGTTPLSSDWSAASRVGYPTTACSGTNSAEIVTVGHGEGSTCTTGWLGNKMNCKRRTAGALFIGKMVNGTEELGHTFASRPGKMSFTYRLHTVNGESASAMIRLENRSGEHAVVLGEGSVSLSQATKENTRGEVVISYKPDTETLKATHIVVYFLSSTAEGPGYIPYYVNDNFNGNPRSRGIGNVLTIDDVTLYYE